MKHSINCTWEGNMVFEADISGHKVKMDASTDHGGSDAAPRPKPLILTSLAGCTGMDVVSLLRKMRVEIDDLNIEVSGELTEEHPKYYKNIHVVYYFKGQNLDKSKIEKAVNLSQDKYCGVSAMLEKSSKLTFEIKYV